MEANISVANEIYAKYVAIRPCLSELGRRIWAASEARSYGRGGIALVSKATGMSNKTIHKGFKDIENPPAVQDGRSRSAGGGRKKITETQRGIERALEELVESSTHGDPESPLKWTNKSTPKLHVELSEQGFKVCQRTICTLLKGLEYTLQSNKKSKEAPSHEDRDAQFNYINETVKKAIATGQPSISVDTKKKENLGEYKNNGREYAKKGTPIKVKTHDFPDAALGKAVPYGVYDIGRNDGWVSVGISSDTAEFAVNTIRTWWNEMGNACYPNASELVITADCGGSNGYRVHLWKRELQKFATEVGLTVHVRHFPPGTSKWNKIEHRMFSYISLNWRGKPLISRETVVNLIGSTRTVKGLMIKSFLDTNTYQKGIVVSKEEMEKIKLHKDEFHPEWNYSIQP